MTYARIVVATDASDGASAAAALALRLGGPHARYRATLVRPERWPAPSASEEDAAIKNARQAIAAWAAHAGLPRPEVSVPTGSVATTLARDAQEFGADLLALGHAGQTRLARRLLGSTARAALRVATMDTLVARARGIQARAPSLRRILVATDFHPPSVAAARRALQIAKAHGSDLALAHVVDPGVWYDPGVEAPPDDAPGWRPPGAQERLDAFGRDHLEGRASTLLLRGRPGAAIARHAREHGTSLVAVGHHGAGALERALIGSAAESIVELAPCSVLVARGGA